MLILITGAPCAGKSTIIARLAKKYHDKIIVLQEAATALLTNGYPPPLAKSDPRYIDWVWHFQDAVLKYQQVMERAANIYSREKYALCDRGSLDGASFVDNIEQFCQKFNLDINQEYQRYRAVIHLQTLAALGTEKYSLNNKFRFHNIQEALNQDESIKKIWSSHDQYYFIEAQLTLTQKVNKIAKILNL